MKKLLFVVFLSGCGAFAVTPNDRAEAYRLKAKDIETACSIYHFDLSANLTPEVPEMTKVCK